MTNCLGYVWVIFNEIVFHHEKEGGCTEITSLPQCTKHFSPPFADDSLILIQANQGDCTHLQTILQLYEDCSIRPGHQQSKVSNTF